MKCLVCKYEGAFGYIDTFSSNGDSSLIGRMPDSNSEFGHNVGSVSIHVCPNCGALHSDI